MSAVVTMTTDFGLSDACVEGEGFLTLFGSGYLEVSNEVPCLQVRDQGAPVLLHPVCRLHEKCRKKHVAQSHKDTG